MDRIFCDFRANRPFQAVCVYSDFIFCEKYGLLDEIHGEMGDFGLFDKVSLGL
jgi:hypothetical protein